MDNKNMFLDWDDVIEDEGMEYVILDEGDYIFRVTGFERGRFPGSAKIPACNKATVNVEVKTDKGVATSRFDLLLYRTLEWKMCAFFRSIGQKKHGEKTVMDWNNVVNCFGKAHFKPRSYVDKNGDKKQINELDRFIDYDEAEISQYIMSEIDVTNVPF